MMRSCFAFIAVLSHLFGVGVHCLVSDDPVLPITLNVAILTAGLPEISTGALLATLRTSLPRYFPANEGGKPIHDIQLLLNYDMRSLQNEFLQKYEAFIEEHAADEDGYHVLFVDEVAHFLQTELEAIGSVMPNFAFPLFDTFTLPVMIIDSKNIKKHLITANADEIESCTMSLLSSVAFLDLSAKACDVTKAVSHDAAQIKWVTPDVKSPYPFTFPISRAPVYDPSIEHFNSHITSRMTGLVTSAVQAMSTGNLQWRPAHATEKIYCPIVVLRNGIAAYNEEAHPNIPALESWLQSILLPHQQVVLMTSVHYIDEHPQLSVAIAAAHMTYATTVLSGSTSHVEKIPYIDSNLLFHEMASVGDKLCDLLFHQYGNGEALRILQQELDIEESMGPRVKVGHSDLTNKKKATRSATVVPVFVIGDLHIHHDRHLAASKTGKTKVEEHFPSAVPEIPVQPLFDKDSFIAVDSDSSAVLVLHSSEDSVNTFSPHTRTWRGTSLTDLDSLIAEGLTKALTGFSAPHKQREGSDMVDVTWTHGMHPFNPFGHLSYEPETYHSLFSTSIKRGILIARAHRLMQRAISIGHRSGGIEAEISDAFRYLHSLHGSSRQVEQSDIFLPSFSSNLLSFLPPSFLYVRLYYLFPLFLPYFSSFTLFLHPFSLLFSSSFFCVLLARNLLI